MRVNGPYQHRRKWRLVVVSDAGKRNVRSFDNKRDAEEAAEAFQRLYCGQPTLTISEALEKYEHHLKTTGNYGDTSITTVRNRLLGFIEDVRDTGCHRITGMDERYKKLTTRWAATTHHLALSEARSFGKWLVKNEHCKTNPFDGIEAIGRPKKRKPQLRVDEARLWMIKALELAPKKPGAIAALCGLLMGMRASEIVERKVRDLDDDGRVLVIEDSKTDASTRRLAIPDVLRPLLRARCADKLPNARLFNRTRQWVRQWTMAICKLAGVPPVCAHGMRGTHATLAIEAGMSPNIVASSLGHTSSKMTLGAYAIPGAQATATREAAVIALRGTDRGTSPGVAK